MHTLGLCERDKFNKYITSAIQKAGLQQQQFCKKVKLVVGRVRIRGKQAALINNFDVKGELKSANFMLYARANLPVSILETTRAMLSVGHGMQQTLAYPQQLDTSFNTGIYGKEFLSHDWTSLIHRACVTQHG